MTAPTALTNGQSLKAALAKATADGSVQSFDPNDLWIYGIDAPEGFEVAPESNFIDADSSRHDRLDRALVQSIMDHGVVDPVLFRAHEGRAVVVDGRRRVLHARQANIELVAAKKTPVRVRAILDGGSQADDVTAREHALIANIFAVKHSPIAEAKLAKSLMAEYTRPTTEGGLALSVADATRRCCATFGFTRPTLGNRLMLLELEPAVQKAIESGKIGAMAGLKMIGKTPEEQGVMLAAAVAAGADGSTHGTATAAAAAGTRGTADPDADKPLSAKRLKQFLETDAAQNLEPLVLKTIRAVLGMISLKAVPGLKACENEIFAREAEDQHDRDLKTELAKKNAARKAKAKVQPAELATE